MLCRFFFSWLVLILLLFPPPRQSLDELEDDDGAEKDEREEQLVLANTFQNETMTADPATGLVAVRKDTSFVENGISVFK